MTGRATSNRPRTLRLWHWAGDDLRGPDVLVDLVVRLTAWLHCRIHGHSEYEKRRGRSICAVCWHPYGGDQ